jgi:aspartyl-tRNA synthetase
MYRTHHCNELRKSDIGSTATLAGWVHIVRDHGGVIFIDLRDREGLTQVVFRPEENAVLAKEAHNLRHEDVIQVAGKVSARVPGTENPKLPTGDIELVPDKLTILNRADVLPFPIDAETPNEDLRLSYRYVDRGCRALFVFATRSPKRHATTSMKRASSRSRRPSFPKARRKERAISSSRAE